jgi:hypothetical protein
MENNARNAAAAYKEARAMVEKLHAKPQAAATDSLIKQVEALAPAEAPAATGGRGGRGGGGGGGGLGAPADPPEPANLATIGGQMVGAVQGMQGAEMAPTAAQLQACAQQEAAYTALMAKWAALKAKANPPATTAAAATK